jgi:1,4-dihydroxy-2-naphthoate octaprenyltransferase
VAASIQAWYAAARPRTLSASIVPVAIGAALAFRDGAFHPTVAGLTLATAVLIQIGTNLANDYYDFVRGADDEHRLGPLRATQSGMIAAESIRNAAFAVLITASVCGVILVGIGGWPIGAIGIVSLVSALTYTVRGPLPTMGSAMCSSSCSSGLSRSAGPTTFRPAESTHP